MPDNEVTLTVGVRVPKCAGDDGETLMVVCSDGSTWRFFGPGDGWIEGPPIPGTIRHRQLKGQE